MVIDAGQEIGHLLRPIPPDKTGKAHTSRFKIGNTIPVRDRSACSGKELGLQYFILKFGVFAGQCNARLFEQKGLFLIVNQDRQTKEKIELSQGKNNSLLRLVLTKSEQTKNMETQVAALGPSPDNLPIIYRHWLPSHVL